MSAKHERFVETSETFACCVDGRRFSSCVARICEVILRDEQTVLPVSTMTTGQHGVSGVYLSLPCVVGRGGVSRVIELPLDEAERAGLRASADLLGRTLDSLAAGNTTSAG